MIKCFCSGRCPGHSGNGTCTLQEGGYCYAFVQEVVNVDLNVLEPEYSYGCLPPEESGYMQCKGDLSPHQIVRSISCCRNFSLCNQYLKPPYRGSYGPAPDLKGSSSFVDSFMSFVESPDALYLLLPLLFALVLTLITMLIYIYKALKSKQVSSEDIMTGYSFSDGSDRKKKNIFNNLFKRLFSSDIGSIDLERDTSSYSDEEDRDDGCLTKNFDSSGGTVPQLVSRTIHREIIWQNNVGRGRYGEVWRGTWMSQEVAIKVFSTTEEASWKREQAIYKLPLLRHPNLLQFIATDICGTGCKTLMLLITDYHENGSLFDVLSARVLNQSECLRLMHSAAAGLAFLHSEIPGSVSKPQIAHRDIKSKNILVKSDMTCCLADLGLSVTYESSKKILDIAENTRVGTKRYMAPEVLDQTLKTDEFESYRRADIYSFALVLWEIMRRSLNYEYQVPYQGLVPNDPSFEDMKKLICDEEVRPDTSSPAWNRGKFYRTITKILLEGWSADPKVRPTAYRIEKNLHSLLKSVPTDKAINNKNMVNPTDLTIQSDSKKLINYFQRSTGSTGKSSLPVSEGISDEDSKYKVSFIRADPALIANGFVRPPQEII